MLGTVNVADLVIVCIGPHLPVPNQIWNACCRGVEQHTPKQEDTNKVGSVLLFAEVGFQHSEQPATILSVFATAHQASSEALSWSLHSGRLWEEPPLLLHCQ